MSRFSKLMTLEPKVSPRVHLHPLHCVQFGRGTRLLAILTGSSVLESMARRKVVIFSALWLVVIFLGGFVVVTFENRPGETNPALKRWPWHSGISLDATLPTLVLFAHPKCPCSRATLGELALLMARCSKHVAAMVIFTDPVGVDDNWGETDLWRSAQVIPGVTVLRDYSGVEARRFGAVTSGDVMLYGRDGRLRFHGGITEGRGHAGDNEGRDTLALLIEGKPARTTTTPVFGCQLFAGDSVQPSKGTCLP